MRSDGLTGDQRQPFGLLRAILFEQELGEGALALAEGRAILERGENPDRFAEEALRPRKLALAPRHPRREVERAAERPGGSGFGEVPASGLQRGVGSVELPAIEMELTREAERPAAGLGTAALLGQQDRLLDERRGAGGQVATAERRLELDGAYEQMARGPVRLACEGPQACFRERLGRLALQVDRHRAGELGGQLRRMVEVIGPDLEQLFARALLQP